MNPQYRELCSLLLSEYFGEVVGKVAENLQGSRKPLSLILSSTGLPVLKVKNALAVLIQYGFVVFEPGEVQSVLEYTLLHERILLILRYPRYITVTKEIFGSGAALLLTEVIKHGNLEGSDAILKAFKVAKEGATITSDEITLGTLRTSLYGMISDYFLERCSYHVDEKDQNENTVLKLAMKESELYQLPSINLTLLTEMESKGKRENPGDYGIYWKVNFYRFHQHMRDDIMINAVKERIDGNAGELMKHLLQLMHLRRDPEAAVSKPVPIIELKENITEKSGNSYLKQHLEVYLKLMEENSSNFITKISDSRTCQVLVNLSEVFSKITCNFIANIVDQRFGSKASQIFRLVCSLKYAEEEQIQKLAFLTVKDAKQITDKLMQEGFLQMQVFRNPTVGMDAQESFIFHVDINTVVSLMMNNCHKAIFSALTRKRLERHIHKRLLVKNKQVQNLIQMLLVQEDINEDNLNKLIDEYMSPSQRTLFESAKEMFQRLQLEKSHVDETLFLLHTYSTTKDLNS